MLDLLLPAALPLPGALILVAVSAVTSAMTTAMGIGGGIVLLAVMTAILPAQAIIPVHAVVQLGSNVGRASVMWRHVGWRLVAVLGAGTVVGIALGALVVVEMPAGALRITLALFILWSVWLTPPRLQRMSHAGASLVGASAGILTMFVGATGIFILAVLRSFGLGRFELVATHAASMAIQHGFKIVAFGVLGFAFPAWLPLIVVMIGAGLLGTFVGRRILMRVPEARFRLILKWMLTVLAIGLITRSLADLWSGS